MVLFNDVEAFRKLFVHYNNSLYKLAFSLTGSQQVSEDIISETFAGLWQGRGRLLEIENLTVYLYVAVKNLSLRHLSRSNNHEIFSLDDVHVENLPATQRSPEDMTISREMIRLINEAVDSLPPECRLIFRLIREDGLKYREVSRILDISVKTIDAQMAIASRKLTQRLRFLLKK